LGNPQFRQWWIQRARRDLEEGYRGIYIDDVNLDWRVGDGDGRWVQPRDPRTGRAMRLEDWRRYMAEFLERVRLALPHAEIAQNVIWYAGGPARDQDSYVRRALAMADYVVLERGVNDGGLTKGNGRFGLGSFLAYVDRRHAHGTPVVFDANRTDAPGREYGLAGYFLISSGRDGTGNPAGSTPDAWWSGYDVDLGRPLGRRYVWHGLLRRDFTRGLVLLNQPDGGTARIRLARPYRDLEGRLGRNLTIPPASGSVLCQSPGG
jgi:hypothetical protein